MQKLSAKLKNVPTDISHICSSTNLALNRDESLSVLDGMKNAKLTDNILDATLTSVKTDKPLKVFVINQNNMPLMPCKPRKARKLLESGKAKVKHLTPFTIQLIHKTGGNKQPVTLGNDSGYLHVALTARTEKEELLSIDATLRNDRVKLNSERRMYRRTRRSRLWYREPRFNNRAKERGWLAPSLQHKLDSHEKLIDFVKSILPITDTITEVANFDIQKIKNPSIFGTQYQQGEQLDSYNVREYVLHRDGHKCQYPRCKHKDLILNVHHIKSRQTGGDSPSNLITLCKSCHDKLHKNKIELKVKPSRSFKAETFMTLIRKRLIEEIGSEITYGYITKAKRIELGLSKSHVNDAFVISGGTDQTRCNPLVIKQVRSCNRKLHKGPRSAIKNTAPRFVFGFQRYDKVEYKGITCFIFGRRVSGYFELRKLDGTKVSSNASYKKIKLIESARTMLICTTPNN